MILRAAKWVAGRLLRLVPESLRGRILPAPFGFRVSELPPPPAAPNAAIRVYIAPVNYAGQGYQWARAIDRHLPGAGAINMAFRMPGDFGYPADDVVPVSLFASSRRWQKRQFQYVVDNFTHVVVEAERQPFGAVLDESTFAQVGRLRRRGLGVLMLCHGTDIRIPSRHAAAYASSPFRDSMRAVAPRLERIARRNHALLARLGLPVFVSTPDLLFDEPDADWLPVVVDVARWQNPTPPLAKPRPVVAHAPSSGPVKGSDLIDPVLRRLDAEGLIAYRRVQGVPADRMPEVYRDADIVLDQFRIGNYGVAACEAMAAGRVVVSHVNDFTRGVVRERAGRELPIVEATAEELERALRDIVADPEPARALAAEGPGFVAAIHDGRRSADVLKPHLEARS